MAAAPPTSSPPRSHRTGAREPAALVTRDFAHEYEAELESLVRARVLLWLGLWLALWCIWIAIHAAAAAARDSRWLSDRLIEGSDPSGFLAAVGRALPLLIQSLQWDVPEVVHASFCLTIIAGTRLAALRAHWSRRRHIRTAFWVLLAHAAATLFLEQFVRDAGSGGGDTFRIAATFWIAALILPWSIGEAATAAVGLIVVWEISRLWLARETISWSMLIQAQGLILLVTPGVLIAWFRQSRIVQSFEGKMLRRSHEWFSRELFDAERIHDAMFPAPVSTGPVRFNFADRTAEGIGGSFLHAHVEDDGTLHLVLLQASGQGIAAAMTVNRLHGEVERLFAERPGLAPADLLDGLGHYTRLMLSPVGISAQASAFRLAPDGRLTYATTGSMAAYLRSGIGSVLALEAPLNAPSATRPLDARDVLVAWTSELRPGASDSPDPETAHLNVRLSTALTTLPPHLPDQIPRLLLDRINQQEPSDGRPLDLLILSLWNIRQSVGLADQVPPGAGSLHQSHSPG